MSRFTKENLELARTIIGRYPQPRSAMIPLLHLVQEQDGYLTKDGMRQVAELLELTPAEVYGTATFYEMFKMHPVGTYLVNVCTNVSCMLLGAYELLASVEEKLGVSAGATTADGVFTVDDVECIAACTQAPCLSVNYRVFGPVDPKGAGKLIDDLRAGKLEETVPRHGVTTRVRQTADATSARRTSAPEPSPQPPGPGATQPESADETAPTRRPDGD